MSDRDTELRLTFGSVEHRRQFIKDHFEYPVYGKYGHRIDTTKVDVVEMDVIE